MTSTSFHPAGFHAALRGVGGKVFWAYPTIVVQDTDDLIALFMPAGVHGKDVDHHPKPEEFGMIEEITVNDVIWQWTDVLYLIVPSEPFSTYLMWETGTRNLRCVYINLQDPIQHTPIGYDTMDHMLDIVVSPDLAEWRWKDEDEIAEAEQVGYFSPDAVRQIRRNGMNALHLIRGERRARIENWMAWQPNPLWQLPQLPDNWNSMNHEII